LNITEEENQRLKKILSDFDNDDSHIPSLYEYKYKERIRKWFKETEYYQYLMNAIFLECFFERKKQLKKEKYKVFQKRRLFNSICSNKLRKLLNQYKKDILYINFAHEYKNIKWKDYSNITDILFDMVLHDLIKKAESKNIFKDIDD